MKHGYNDVVLQLPRSGSKKKDIRLKTSADLDVGLHDIDEMPPREFHVPLPNDAADQREAVLSKEDKARILENIKKLVKHLFPDWFSCYWIINQFDIMLPYLERLEKQCTPFVPVRL